MKWNNKPVRAASLFDFENVRKEKPFESREDVFCHILGTLIRTKFAPIY